MTWTYSVKHSCFIFLEGGIRSDIHFLVKAMSSLYVIHRGKWHQCHSADQPVGSARHLFILTCGPKHFRISQKQHQT